MGKNASYEKGKISEVPDFLEGNIFYKSLGQSPATECALWILENERKVKNKIKYTFASMGHSDGDVDECYDYMVYYFLEFTHNAFDENYFVHKETMEKIDLVESIEELEEIKNALSEQDNDEGYSMDAYIMNRVKNGALGYIRHLNRSREMLKFDEVPFGDEARRGPNTITIDSATSLQEDNIKYMESEPDLWVEYSELQEMLDNDLHIYDEEFQSKGLRDFNTAKFVQALFLMGFEEGRDDDEIAEYLGVPVSMLNNYKSGFKIIVKDESGPGGEYCDLLMTITDLVDGVKHGWKPIIRD